MSQRSDERDVRIFRVHDQPTDGMRVAKSGKLPRLAGVDRFVHPVSAHDVAADASFSGANIDDVGIGFGNGQRTDGRGSILLLVKERLPIEPAIGSFPYAARNASEIIGVVLADDAGDGENASAAKRSDEAIVERFPRAFVFFVVLLRGCHGSRRLGTLLRFLCSAFFGFLRLLLLSECRSNNESKKGQKTNRSQRFLHRALVGLES